MEDWTLVPHLAPFDARQLYQENKNLQQQIAQLQGQTMHLQASVDALKELLVQLLRATNKPPLVIPGISAIIGTTFEVKRDLNWNIRKGKNVPFVPERLPDIDEKDGPD